MKPQAFKTSWKVE